MNPTDLVKVTSAFPLEAYFLLFLMGLSATLFCIFGRLSLDGLQVVMLSRGEKGPGLDTPIRPHRFLRVASYWAAISLAVQTLRFVQLTTCDQDLSLWCARLIMVCVLVSNGLLWMISSFLLPLKLPRWANWVLWSGIGLWSLIALATPWLVSHVLWLHGHWFSTPGPLQWWRLGFSLLVCLVLIWALTFQIRATRAHEDERVSLSRSEAQILLTALVLYAAFMSLGALAARGLILFPRSASFTFALFAVVLAVILGRRVRSLASDTYASSQSLRAQNLALEEMTRQAQAASEARAQFLASMSHELRTPLTGILGMAEMLATSQLNPPQRAYVEQLIGCGGTLRALIDDVLDLSRIDRHTLVVSERRFDPLDVLEDVARAVAVNAHGKGLDILLCTTPHLESAFCGDVDRIRQIVLNLAGNAVKYTTHGRVTLSASSRHLEGARYELRFSVADTGPGISSEQREHIFLPYVQGAVSEALRPSGGQGGVGLGLTIVGEIARAIGAKVELETSLGEGSTFHLVMQVDCLDHETLATRLGKAWGQARPIAWVDSQQSVSQGWAETLTQAGWPIRFIDTLDELKPGEQLVIPASLRSEARALGLRFSCVMSLTAAAFDETERVLLAPITRKQLLTLAEPEQHLPQSAVATPKRVRQALVVEDHSVNRLVITYLLRAWGYEVWEAQSVAEALELPFMQTDLTLLDGELPDGTGFDVAEVMRAQGYQGAIVGLTASGLESDRLRGEAAGFDDLVFKPFEHKQLRDRIEKALQARASLS